MRNYITIHLTPNEEATETIQLLNKSMLRHTTVELFDADWLVTEVEHRATDTDLIGSVEYTLVRR